MFTKVNGKDVLCGTYTLRFYNFDESVSSDEELSSFLAQDSIRPRVNAKKAAM